MRETAMLGTPTEKLLRRTSNVLVILIILMNGYVLLVPFLPKIKYEIKHSITRPVKVTEDTAVNLDRSTNHLILPTIQLDEPVFSGNNPSIVHKGIWHRPNTSTPDKGGNTVLVGHRFTYQGSAVFYNLDKLKNNDDVYLVHEQKIYHYRVKSSKIVPSTAREVEASTNDAKLTLYTCTPLVTAKDRLVYEADLVGVL